jgi:hypothetical protein
MMRQAQAIAEAGLRDTASKDSSALCLSEAFAAFHAHCQQARERYNGRELTLFESEPEKAYRLFNALLDGNYRETAAKMAGITNRAIQIWMQRADEGDPRYDAFANVVRAAEALAESNAVRNVRAAGKDARFWAAEMTWLERRYPDKWGRRQEDTAAPKVIVNIGVKDSDVQIQVKPTDPSK